MKFMLLVLLFILILYVLISLPLNRSRNDSLVRKQFTEWMSQNKKVYINTIETEKRFHIFKNNLKIIENFNKNKNTTWYMGVNQFTDLSPEEEASACVVVDPTFHATRAASYSHKKLGIEELPRSVDWRTEGAVRPVKDQKKCRSCWAFATIAAVESIITIKSGKQVTLSEQELVDCVTQSAGCAGGSVHRALDYIIENLGVSSEKSYPYVGRQGQCLPAAVPFDARIDDYEFVSPNDELSLLEAVSRQPVIVAIDSSGIKKYTKGISRGPCGRNVDHAVIIVGYDTTLGGIDYWIVRNSWGPDWGEEGYVRMRRNLNSPFGLCGINMFPTYPVYR